MSSDGLMSYLANLCTRHLPLPLTSHASPDSKPHPATNPRKERHATRTPLCNGDSFVLVEIDADAAVIAHPNLSGVVNPPNFSVVKHSMRPIIPIGRVCPFGTTENGLDFRQGHALADQFAVRFADSTARQYQPDDDKGGHAQDGTQPDRDQQSLPHGSWFPRIGSGA